MRGTALEDDPGVDHPLAPHLDCSVGWLHDDCGAGAEESRHGIEDGNELVAGEGAFLSGVEEPDGRVGPQVFQEMDHDGQAGLHVGRTEPVQSVPVDPRPDMPLEWDGVEMTDEENRL